MSNAFITKEDIIDFLEDSGYNLSNYSVCLESDIVFYKCTNKDFGEFFEFTPRKRISHDPLHQNTNYHTLWLSNHPDWKDYPKRDKAIIFSSLRPERMYGDYTYQMFIPDNANIAICRTNDLFNTFDRSISIYDVGNEIIKECLKSVGIYNEPTTWKELKAAIIKADKSVLTSMKIARAITKNHPAYDDSLWKFLENYYDTYNVELCKLTDIFNTDAVLREKEIWTDVPCIGVKI